ncbi:MAG TPA: uridine kinase [Verrucomicrobiae bacterium]
MNTNGTTHNGVFIIAIAGGSGSGKTWLANSLRQSLGGEATHLALDDFYLDRSDLPENERGIINFDTPSAIDWRALKNALAQCKRGESLLHVPRYDFATHTRMDEVSVLPVKPVVIVDGLWLFHRMALRAMFDLKIFVECPNDLRFCRRMERDVLERGRTADSVTEQFKATVLPMHEKHVQPQAKWADTVICSPPAETDVLHLAEKVKAGSVKASAKKFSMWSSEPLNLKCYECLAD